MLEGVRGRGRDNDVVLLKSFFPCGDVLGVDSSSVAADGDDRSG